MVHALSRNPLLRLLLDLWWLPVLAAPIFSVLLGFWAPWPLPAPGWVTIAYGAALAGMIGVACLHAADAALRERSRHECAGHRFLCPHCLHFGEFRFACGACGHEIDALTVHTRGAYVDDCSHCKALLFSRDGETGVGAQAWCRRCSHPCEREIHHERQVRVMGTLRESDFAAVCAAIGTSPVRTRAGIPIACHDNGAQLTFVLSQSDLPRHAGMLPATHAVWAVERIWLDGNGVEPLKLGEAVDRYLHRMELSGSQRQAMTICVGGEAPDAARRLLSARFGRVVGHVAPARLIGAGAARVLAPPGRVGAVEGGG